MKNPIFRLGFWYQRFIGGPWWDGRNWYEAARKRQALEKYLRDHPEALHGGPLTAETTPRHTELH